MSVPLAWEVKNINYKACPTGTYCTQLFQKDFLANDMMSDVQRFTAFKCNSGIIVDTPHMKKLFLFS